MISAIFFHIPPVFDASNRGSRRNIAVRFGLEKLQLSYRKQIARQLRTQYVEGICRPKYYTLTLTSRLMVTQGHWKRNHWIDHTRLTVSRLI